MLYDLNQENRQKTLTQAFAPRRPFPTDTMKSSITSTVTFNNQDLSESSLHQSAVCANGKTVNVNQDPVEESDEEEFFECSQEIQTSPYRPISTKSFPIPTANEDIVNTTNCDQRECGKTSEQNEMNLQVQGDISETSLQDLEQVGPRIEIKETSDSTKSERIKNATDEGFLEEFFSRSRLHLISDQKKEMQIMIANMRKNMSEHNFFNLKGYETEVELSNKNDRNEIDSQEDSVCLMHIDMDCFFVSVGLLGRPHLRGKPVAVTHSSGKVQDSKSDIACASYEAREFGVKNGMWVGDAKAICPNLEVIPYDFEEYRRVSKLFFEAVSTFTLDIEPCSVDEMIIDATSILKQIPGSTPNGLAEFIRKIIWEKTECPASVGIGSNRLLAKLAVKLAKPNGVYHLKDCDAASYIEKLSVRDLPGIGWSNEDKLQEKFGVETCGDLLKIPLKDLKTVFGERNAEKMQSACKGIDLSELKFGIDHPKSISVDVNFGIRFTKEEEVTAFMSRICKELSNRALRIQALSSHFTLKLLIRRKGAGDPLKHGGFGIVDSITRSRSLFVPTRNWLELYKTACSLIRLMRIPPEDYRGVGVTLSDLTFDCDKIGKKSVQRTLTDMPLSRAQKMLSISQKRRSNPSCATQENVISSKDMLDCSNAMDDDSSVPEHSISPPSGPPAETSNLETSDELALITNGETGAHHSAKANRPQKSKLPPEVDINILRQLPRDLAEEQCRMFGLQADVLDQVHESESSSHIGSNANAAGFEAKDEVMNSYDSLETVDQSFLSALPDSVRQDVLIHLQEVRAKRNSEEEPFDDQQPCTSKQAMERNKKQDEILKPILAEEEESAKTSSSDFKEISEEEIEENSDSDLKVVEKSTPIKCIQDGDDQEHQPLEQQTTPLLGNSDCREKPFDPETFWDMNISYHVLPSENVTLPSLNACSELEEIRNLIRRGLEVVVEPSSDDVDTLEFYFKELISNGWLSHTQILLKFIKRRMEQLDEDSQWIPILKKIIKNTQKTCKRLYHGKMDIESNDE